MKFTVEINWTASEVRVTTERGEFVRGGLSEYKIASSFGTCTALLNVLLATLEMQEGQDGISEQNLRDAQAHVEAVLKGI